jgi:hypothetical protein
MTGAPAALASPSGGSCTATGSGTTFTIDLVVPAGSLPQGGIAIGVSGATVVGITTDGYSGTPSTNGLPEGASDEELLTQQFASGTIVIHITLSTAYTGPEIMAFPTNFPPSSYFDQLNCMISSNGSSGGSTSTVTQPSNNFKPYSNAGYSATRGFYEWTVVPGPGIVSFRDPLLGATGVNNADAKPLIKPGKVVATKAGDVTLPLVPTTAGKSALKATGTIKIALAITFTPTGGTPNTETVKLTLREKK